MANRNLKFFDKRGHPLNFEYVGPSAEPPLTYTFNYESSSYSASPPQGGISLYDISSNIIYLNKKDMNGYDLTLWANTINTQISQGGKIILKTTFYPANILEGEISSISIGATILTINFSRVLGTTIISDGNTAYLECLTQNLPGGYFTGSVFFEPVSAGLFENEQIFIVQEFRDSSTNSPFVGLPHTGATGSASNPLWRTRWENQTYGNTDVSNIIFTYQIVENDPDLNGDPSIKNYENIAFPVIKNPSDSYSFGYIVTPESATPSRALSVNVALGAPEIAAEIYERRLIIEDITYDSPSKVAEILFYGQVIGEDSRLDVLTKNLGRAFFGSDSPILRNHDPNEPLPNYLEINEKRKELMVAGEEIFPYIGSYKGLIGALKFFGYQDLRIKEYWLNLQFNQTQLTPLEENKIFLDNYDNSITANQSVLIADVLDNENSGKYRLEQTYGPNEDGEYILDVSSENTLVPSRTYKKTSLFGLYYDINRTSDLLDDYGYPITPEAFAFTQEEVLLKLFALKERLKKSYLPLNARIIDITGEGVYYNIYNAKEWTDFVERYDITSGNNIDFVVNPDFGFIEDLRAFGTRTSPISIQAPMNYDDAIEIGVTVVGPTGDAFLFSTSPKLNSTLELSRGKKYIFNVLTSGYDFYITTDPGLTQVDPLGILNNGASTGSVVLDLNPQEQSTLYYYSSINPVKLTGSINVNNAPISDFGNIVNPLHNGQRYDKNQNLSLINAISEFYYYKENGLLENLGDNVQDPISDLDPVTGDPYINPIGMPLVLELQVDTWDWAEMGMSWDSMSLPAFSFDNQALTWDSIDFSTYNEIEWIIQKSPTQSGSPYYFSYRGYAFNFYKLAHFLPYPGIYDVTCYIYDSFNFKNRKIRKQAINVSPRTIQIDAWTRYRENERYIWDQTIRSWDDYDSIWEYPAEGKSYSDLTKEIPEEILDFAIYGNNAVDGQNLSVLAQIPSVGASGNFVIDQNILTISKAYSKFISGDQYGFATIHTTEPHNFISGENIFITGSIPTLNKSWKVIIPEGATGYSFQVPYVINNEIGVGLTSGISSIVGGTGYYVLPDLYPDQKTTGGGGISVSVDGRVIGATSSGSNLQATVNSIIEEINKVTTQPDYFAQSLSPSSDPATINIVADPSSGSIGNDKSLTVNLTGSLILVSSDSFLSGGVTGGTSYVNWDPAEGNLPVDNLKYFGTKFLDWETFTDPSWDEAYAHSWDDFGYESGWLGGYEIHSSKIGDHIKISTGAETFPFPTGVTFGTTGSTGASAYLVLESAVDQLNNSSDPNITNFYYRVIPSTASASLTTSAPLDLSFYDVPATGGTAPIPASIPGAPAPLVVSFTYATGP
jgi:hypothetical protein